MVAMPQEPLVSMVMELCGLGSGLPVSPWQRAVDDA
jgi:hypothetical protein